MFVLENDQLKMEVSAHGAELKKVYHKTHDFDALWEGDPKFWGRVSPVLFPIVGRVAQDTYFVNNEAFSLTQHGFARDEDFQLVSQSADSLWFEISHSPRTLEKYPYPFTLRIGYVLEGEKITVKWEVVNTGKDSLVFSIGAHPAFSTQLVEGDTLSDYYLHLETLEKVETYLFDNELGLIKDEKEVVIPDLKLLPLSKDLFEEYPTLVLEGETEISLMSYNHDHGVNVKFAGFPFVGIWSPVGKDGEEAPFVCIEPWYGMADTHAEPGELKDKKGIIQLAAGEIFEAEYSMEFK